MQVTQEEACQLLYQGKVVAIPTETVYGLAASLSNLEAIEKIYQIKGRPSDNPLIIHLAESAQIAFFIKDRPPGFETLASSYWPGPMTLVVPVEKEWVPEIVRAGLDTVAFRVPSHPSTLQVLSKVGPLVMPSANISGRPSATCVEHVEADFGRDFPVLNGGRALRGLESTILTYRKNRWDIIRLGALSAEMFEPLLGYLPQYVGPSVGSKPLCPGQNYQHYAPETTLILDPEVSPESIGTVVGFSNRNYPASCRLFALGPINSPSEVAKNFYHVLRQLDENKVERAWVDTDFPEKEGLWATISERLKKASSVKE